ncbi:MAG: hypothetical protein RBS99_15370 [Rhodospirillales bacterium]|jgi:hypothetical protein|nr:hypothetical protein [Rhodospirillales bacterium]
MDVNVVPSKNPTKGDSVFHDALTGSAAQGLIATFSDMLRNAGIRMESDSTSPIPRGKPEVEAARRDTERTDRAAQSRPERRDDVTTAPAERPRRARDGNDRTAKEDTSANTRPTDRPAASEKADRAKTPASAASEAGTPAESPDAANRAAKPAVASEPATTTTGPDIVAAVNPAAGVPAVDGETPTPSAPYEVDASVYATQVFT